MFLSELDKLSKGMKTALGAGALLLFLVLIEVVLVRCLTADDRKDEEMEQVFADCESATQNYDFEKAHLLLQKMKGDYLQAEKYDLKKKKEERYNDAFDYVFNAEAMYLCAKGDKESLNRIVFLLSSIQIKGVSPSDEYIESVKRFNQKCSSLIDLAIANNSYTLAQKVLPLFKEVPEKKSDNGEEQVVYNRSDKKMAEDKVNQAIKEKRIE